MAVEADGAQHHETDTGELIPEDLERQALLEEAGWSFCRVRHVDFVKDAEHEVQRVLDALAKQPANPELARLVWTDDAVEEALRSPVEMVDVEPEFLTEPEVVSDEEPAGPPPTATAEIQPEALEAAEVDSLDAESVAGAVAPQPTPETDADESPENDPVESLIADDPQAAGNASGDGHDVAAPSIPTASSDPNAAPAGNSNGAPASSAGAGKPTIEDTPLALMALQVTETVIEHGRVNKDELGDAYATRHGITLPRAWHRRIRRFAWTANGMKYLRSDGDTWLPGHKAPQPDGAYGRWTYRRIVLRAAEMLPHDDDPFEDLLAEVYSGTRIPKLAMDLVASAINEAKDKG